MWRCPDCRRQFANRNQSHACGRYALASHFEGKPQAVRAVFDKLLAVAKKNGPITVLPEKTRIAFHVRMSFAAFVIRRNWVDGHVVLAGAWKIRASGASRLSRREIICTPFVSKASTKSTAKSQPGSPKRIESAHSGICCSDGALSP
jgi:hypothetical protein